MSYSGEIEAAGLSAVAVYAARSIMDAAAAGIRRMRAKRQFPALPQLESCLSALTARANAEGSALSGSLESATDRCCDDYERTLSALASTCEKTHDTAVFLQECAKARETLYRRIAAKRTALEAGTITGIRETARTLQGQLSRRREEAARHLQHLTDSEAKQARMQELVRAQLLEAHKMAADLRRVCGESVSGTESIRLCEASLARAQELCREGLLDAALTEIYAVQDTAVLRIAERLSAECRSRQLSADAEAALRSAREQLSAREVHLSFPNTRSGEPADVTVPDLVPYFRGAWEELSQELTRLETVLSASPLFARDPQTLEDLLHRLSDWQTRYDKAHILALERVHSELLRKETGRLLVGQYLAQGYTMLPLTAQDRAVSPLDSLIVRLAAPENRGTLTLHLHAVPDEDGHLTMRILIEDHTAYPGSDSEIENARTASRQARCDAIRESGIAQGMHLRHKCLNPGANKEST